MITIDNDGNFLFDGEISTDDRIDDIREFVNEANKAFEVINKVKDMISNPSHNSTSFGILYELNKVNCNDKAANCISNPPAMTITFSNYDDGSKYWYDNQGNAHAY